MSEYVTNVQTNMLVGIGNRENVYFKIGNLRSNKVKLGSRDIISSLFAVLLIWLVYVARLIRLVIAARLIQLVFAARLIRVVFAAGLIRKEQFRSEQDTARFYSECDHALRQSDPHTARFHSEPDST